MSRTGKECLAATVVAIMVEALAVLVALASAPTP